MARFGGKRKRERPTPVQLDEARPARARAEGRAAVVSARTPAGERRPEASHGRAPAGGVQARGPPMRTVSGRMSANYGSPANDEWQTCAQTWASLAPAIERYRAARVWMPFYYDGACAAHLRALGFAHVVHEEGADFFERVCDAAFLDTVDVVIDNPPYSNRETKEKVMRALAACGKPFVLLLPISTLHVAFVRSVLDMSEVQAIVPRRVLVRKRDGPPLPFKYLIWFCYKARFERDLAFLDGGPDAGEGEEGNEEHECR